MTVEKSLNDLIDAWESLPGGQNYSAGAIEKWLRYKMSPAINRSRKVLGRKKPNEAD
jgi:hypothetical protein